MFKILLMTLMIVQTTYAGIGDIAGGQSKEVKKLLRKSDGIRGDKIHFQRSSTWVSSVYNKSICFDGYEFRAIVSTCLEWSKDNDSRRCIRRGKIEVAQPQESERQRCKIRDDEGCAEFETVKYVQKEIKKIEFLDQDDHVFAKKHIKIQSCN